MTATNGTTATFSKRVKATIATGLMVLALTIGAGATTQAGAAAPTSGQVNGQTQIIGTAIPTVDASAVAKPKGTAKPKPDPRPQPPVLCDSYTQQQWIEMSGQDPGPGGYTHCYFYPAL